MYVYIYTYIHTMESYSAMKKNEIIPFAAAWMGIEIIVLRERQTDRDRETERRCGGRTCLASWCNLERTVNQSPQGNTIGKVRNRKSWRQVSRIISFQVFQWIIKSK